MVESRRQAMRWSSITVQLCLNEVRESRFLQIGWSRNCCQVGRFQSPPCSFWIWSQRHFAVRATHSHQHRPLQEDQRYYFGDNAIHINICTKWKTQIAGSRLNGCKVSTVLLQFWQDTLNLFPSTYIVKEHKDFFPWCWRSACRWENFCRSQTVTAVVFFFYRFSLNWSCWSQMYPYPAVLNLIQWTGQWDLSETLHPKKILVLLYECFTDFSREVINGIH